VTPAAAMLTAIRRAPRPEEEAILASARVVTIAGLTAYLWGDGPTVVLVHGWNGGAAQFTQWVAPLVGAGFSALAVDLPAHGISPGDKANVVVFTRAIFAVLAELSHSERGPVAAVVGHSMGGLALVGALTEGAAAERVVLVAPVASISDACERTAQALRLDASARQRFYREIEEIVGLPPSGVDLAPRLAGAPPLPLLVFHDPADREVPFGDAESIVARWPGSAALVPIPGAGHRKIIAAAVDPSVAFLGQRSAGSLHPAAVGAKP
jgi:pimeloyl-ACP methyl ester carboxylesterase